MVQSRRDDDRRVSGRRRAEDHKTYDRTAWTLPEGVSSYRIAAAGTRKIDIFSYKVGQGNPYADAGMLHFERTFFVHSRIGPSEDTYVCAAKTAKQRCAVCEWVAKEGHRSDPAVVKALYPKERQLWLIHDHAEPTKPFQIWDYSFHLFGKQLDARVKLSLPEQGYEYFADPRDGKTLLVGFAEKSIGFGKPCYEAAAFDFMPRQPQSKAFIMSLPCLDDLLIIKPYNELREIFLQTADEGGGDTGDGGQEEPPAQPAPRPGKRPAPAPVAEASDWDEETPAEPTPAPKAKPAAKKPAPAPEPEAEDAGDWDEPATPVAAPKPKAKSAAAKDPAPVAEDTGDDWGEEVAEPAPTSAKKPAAKPKPAPAPVEDEGDAWDEPPVAPPAKPKGGKKTTPPPAAEAADDDWE